MINVTNKIQAQANPRYLASDNARQPTSAANVPEEAVKQDTFQAEKTAAAPTASGIYTRTYGAKVDQATVDRLQQQLDKNTEALRAYVRKLISNQGNIPSSIDAETVKNAQLSIAEDGEWGVNAVSDRLFEFAKAISGGDKSKLDTIKAAIDKGFAQAGQAFNGTLPDICHKTYEATIKKLDDWANEQ